MARVVPCHTFILPRTPKVGINSIVLQKKLRLSEVIQCAKELILKPTNADSQPQFVFPLPHMENTIVSVVMSNQSMAANLKAILNNAVDQQERVSLCTRGTALWWGNMRLAQGAAYL